MRTRIASLFRETDAYASKEITICGWVRTNRSQAQFGFLNVNDGSFFESLQVVYDNSLNNFDDISKIRVGASVEVKGVLVLTPDMPQPFEVKAMPTGISSMGRMDDTLTHKGQSLCGLKGRSRRILTHDTAVQQGFPYILT